MKNYSRFIFIFLYIIKKNSLKMSGPKSDDKYCQSTKPPKKLSEVHKRSL